MNIWFTSDTHFGHKNILKFCPGTRLGSTPEEHDQLLINKWNHLVAPTDEVYILGDVFFCGLEESARIAQQLNGIKHVVLGNHDKVIEKSPSLQKMFASVQHYKELVIDDIHMILFHYPQLEWNGMHRGSFCLFGHVHGTLDNHPEIINFRSMDVGIDSRPNGQVPDHGAMSLWHWSQIKRILERNPIKKHKF